MQGMRKQCHKESCQPFSDSDAAYIKSSPLLLKMASIGFIIESLRYFSPTSISSTTAVSSLSQLHWMLPVGGALMLLPPYYRAILIYQKTFAKSSLRFFSVPLITT